MNKIVVYGNLARDPEAAAISDGTLKCKFTIAVDRRYTDRNGDRPSDFFHVVAWRKLADSCARYLSKGDPALVYGHIENRTYEKDGVRHTITEIIAEEVKFIGRRAAVISSQHETEGVPFVDDLQDNFPF